MTAFAALADLLDGLASTVAQLTREDYRDSDVPGVSGSIGGHVRHCLDHVRALEQALDRGLVDYDARRRDTSVERDREAAILSLISAATRLRALTNDTLGRMVVVRSLLTRDGMTVEGASTVGRELAFVVSHTIHHSAQIALLAHRRGSTRLPRHLGLAPSTPILTGAA